MPDAKHAAGLSQISATFTLLAAKFSGLFHVFSPRHQYEEETSAAYGWDQRFPVQLVQKLYTLKGCCIFWLQVKS